uniref:Uncharacterized protein n=1 Tax=Gasterosteus aculeatus TaxID=69293 RepID=G3NN70_GASAC
MCSLPFGFTKFSACGTTERRCTFNGTVPSKILSTVAWCGLLSHMHNIINWLTAFLLVNSAKQTQNLLGFFITLFNNSSITSDSREQGPLKLSLSNSSTIAVLQQCKKEKCGCLILLRLLVCVPVRLESVLSVPTAA